MNEAPHSAYREAIRRDLQVAARRQVQTHRRRRMQLRLAAASLTALVLLAGTAVAGQSILGARASGAVQSTIDSLWQGGERTALAPRPGNARAVARVGGTVLYRSPGTDPGSVCIELVSTDLVPAPEARAQQCIERGAGAWPTGAVTRELGGRLAFFGQIHPPPGGRLVLDPAGGSRVPVALGVDGWFLGLLPLLLAAPGAPPPLEATLRILDGSGDEVSSIAIARMPG